MWSPCMLAKTISNGRRKNEANSEVALQRSRSKSQVDFSKNVCKGFLTDKEIEEVLNGKEFWLAGEEATRRLQKFSR